MPFTPSRATYKVTYEGKDITRDITPYLISLAYTDKTAGEADELSITLSNPDDRWIGEWQPVVKDRITATIITGDMQLPCGTFTVDGLEAEGSRDGGSIVMLKALGAGVKDSVRTKYSVAHEGKTLRQIAVTVANKYGYTVQGITKDFAIKRVTQMHESDLGFLHRIALDYGYMFSLRGTTLVFTYYKDLNAAASSITIYRSECLDNWRIADKVTGIYQHGRIKHFNSKDKKLYDMYVAAGANPSADWLQLRSKVDSNREADFKIGGRLYRKNLEQVEMSLTCPGSPYLVCGNNITLNGWKNYDGKYMISESTHRVSREGNYITDVRHNRIAQTATT